MLFDAPQSRIDYPIQNYTNANSEMNSAYCGKDVRHKKEGNALSIFVKNMQMTITYEIFHIFSPSNLDGQINAHHAHPAPTLLGNFCNKQRI